MLETLLKDVQHRGSSSHEVTDALPELFTIRVQKSSRNGEFSSPTSPTPIKDALGHGHVFPLRMSTKGGMIAYALRLEEFRIPPEALNESEKHIKIAKFFYEFIRSTSYHVYNFGSRSTGFLKFL